jgi:putative redox protein
MVTITASYDGQLRCTATHGPSGTKLSTDAPKDNHGLGLSFSPTDLVATALVTCAVTTMGIVAKRDGIRFEGVRASIEKVMTATPTRRIAELPLTIHMPAGLTPEQKKKLENTAHTCPVYASLNPETKLPIKFVYGE